MKRPLSRIGLIELRLKNHNPGTIYDELLQVAKERGFRGRWVDYKFKELFGKWPRPQTKRQPMPPSTDLLCWLNAKSRNFGARLRREERKRLDMTPIGFSDPDII